MHELGLYVFSNNNEEKMTVKQNTNWTVFGEIQTATKTFIACLTRFRLILYPKNRKTPSNLHRPMGIHHTYPLPIPMGIAMGIHIPTGGARPGACDCVDNECRVESGYL